MADTPKPLLLFLCQTLPFPPDGGVSLRTYNVLRLLAQRFEVHALCFYRKALARSVALSVQELGRLVASIQVFPIEQEHAPTRLVTDHLRSLTTRTVYTRLAYESAGFRSQLRKLLTTHRFVLAHVDSLDLSGYLDDLQGIPTVVVHHNVESALLARRAQRESNPARRLVLAQQATLMAREEADWCPRVALNVTCSPDDAALLSTIAPGARTAVVPNGVDIDEFRPPPAGARTDGLVFVGGMTWFPNKDALEHFAADIVPELRRTGPLPRITWVGRALPGAQERYAARGIQLTGYVDSVQPFVHAARCFIVPLRVGGGTRLKILAAWAMGQAVVSTTIGCEGLDARDGDNILIRDDPAEFAAAIRQVLTDAELRQRLSIAARRTAESTYAWEVIGERMFADYDALLREPAGASASPTHAT